MGIRGRLEHELKWGSRLPDAPLNTRLWAAWSNWHDAGSNPEEMNLFWKVHPGDGRFDSTRAHQKY